MQAWCASLRGRSMQGLGLSRVGRPCSVLQISFLCMELMFPWGRLEGDEQGESSDAKEFMVAITRGLNFPLGAVGAAVGFQQGCGSRMRLVP